ncbi:unnamed protein product, partial [Closterium sp. NIES-53]
MVRRTTITPHRRRPRHLHHDLGTRPPRRPLHRRRYRRRRRCIGPWVCPVQTATRRKWLVNTAGARAVGEHWHRYQADSEEPEVREEQEEQEVQEDQEEQGALGVQVALEALRAHGYTTRRR